LILFVKFMDGFAPSIHPVEASCRTLLVATSLALLLAVIGLLLGPAGCVGLMHGLRSTCWRLAARIGGTLSVLSLGAAVILILTSGPPGEAFCLVLGFGVIAAGGVLCSRASLDDYESEERARRGLKTIAGGMGIVLLSPPEEEEEEEPQAAAAPASSPPPAPG
jgi:hypothetical protein